MCKTHHRTEQHRHTDLARVSNRGPATDRPRTERVGDRDRERTAGILQAAAGDGLIGIDELEERLTATWSARTRDQLAAVTADLPQGSTDHHAKAARQAAAARRGRTALHYQALAFAVAMLVMVSIWLATGAGYVWPIWPALGWGPCLLWQWQTTHARSRRAHHRPLLTGGQPPPRQHPS